MVALLPFAVLAKCLAEPVHDGGTQGGPVLGVCYVLGKTFYTELVAVSVCSNVTACCRGPRHAEGFR